jgi:hypothetical protein
MERGELRPFFWVVVCGALSGCPGAEPTPMVTEPLVEPPAPPEIPWLEAGAPTVEAPRIPWLTDASACPPGWGLTELAAGLSACDPYPAGRRDDCGPTAAHFPGEPGCRDLDSGETDWPSALPATGVIYVRAGASGGDGSTAAPFGTLGDALAAATEGATLALAPGRYEGKHTVTVAGLTILGTSVASTVLLDPSPALVMPDTESARRDATLVVEAEGVEVRDVAFEGEHSPVGVLSGDATLTRLLVVGTRGGLGALGAGAALTVEDAIFRGLADGAVGVVTTSGASATVRRVTFEGFGGTGLLAEGVGTRMRAEDVSAVDLVPVPAPGGGTIGGQAAWVMGGADAELTRVAVDTAPPGIPTATGIEVVAATVRLRWALVGAPNPLTLAPDARVEATDLGLVARAVGGSGGIPPALGTAPGSTLTATRLALAGLGCAVLQGTDSLEDVACAGTTVAGFYARAGGTARIARVEVRDVAGPAFAADAAATLVVEDARASDLPVSTEGNPGAAVFSYRAGSTVRVTRMLSEGGTYGLWASTGGAIEATDVTVRGLREQLADYIPSGVVADRGGSSVVATRLLVEDVDGIGVQGFEATLALSDAVVRDWRGPPRRGSGAFVTDTPAMLDRVVLADGEGSGLVAVGAASIVSARDLDVRGTRARATTGLGGYGTILAGAALSAERVSITDVELIGLAVDGGSATLSDFRVERVRANAGCLVEPCPPPGAAGVTSTGPDAVASLTRFIVRDVATVGLLTDLGGTLTLSDGLVEDAPFCSTTADTTPLPMDVDLVACGPGSTEWRPE